MEKFPSSEMPEKGPERELSFDEKLALASALYGAVDEANDFIKRQGGIDTFAEAGQYMEDMREAFDKLEADRDSARAEFDKKVSDKKDFVRKLREIGENDVADRIKSMFGLKEDKDGFFSRFLKK